MHGIERNCMLFLAGMMFGAYYMSKYSYRGIMKSSQEDLCGCRIIHHDEVVKAAAEALPEMDLKQLGLFFKALADVSRLKILDALSRREMCVCDLAVLLGISESAVSHQLRLLRTIQLVDNRRSGNVLYYRLADKHIRMVLDTALEHIREEK